MAERVGLEPTVRLPVLNAVGNCSIPRRTVILFHALTEKERDVTVFTDNDFHNIGIGILRHHVGPLAQQADRDLAQGHLASIDAAAITSDMSVLGRFLITKKQNDIASFKTPDLRNILVDRALFPRRVHANTVHAVRRALVAL
jgi:cytochrome c peroxidase